MSDPWGKAFEDMAYGRGIGFVRIDAQGEATHVKYSDLYLGQFPPPLKEGDGAIWKGRNVIIRKIEPDGERGRALVKDFETGRERNVNFDHLMPLPTPPSKG